MHDHLKHQVSESSQNETRTWRVFILTLTMMVVEIVSGMLTGSMALLADGWHMGTHTAAFGITIFAYRYARRNQSNRQFSFGPGKVNPLGGFASAVALAVVALFMIIESIERFIQPVDIQFNEAIVVAIIGLVVNLVSAVLLMGTSVEDHTHSHHHHDHNLRSAYFHVLADALTSLTAIFALFTGKYLGWEFMDPVMGIVGALVIIVWARGLLRSSAGVLLDKTAGGRIESEIREGLAKLEGIQISDLRLWYLSSDRYALGIKYSGADELSPEQVRSQLASNSSLAYIIAEKEFSQQH